MIEYPDSLFRAENYSKDRYRCEYLVVGTGAGGSVAGSLLAESGKDVIMLEEGGYWPAEAMSSDISHGMARLYRNRGVAPIARFIRTSLFHMSNCLN